MKQLSLLLLLALAVVALLTSLRPLVVSAHLEATPILGEPELVTPLANSIAVPEPDPAEATMAPTSTSAAAQSRAAAEPDSCEPNNTPERACIIPLDESFG